MESKRRILFIINPISGTGKKKVVEKLLDQYLDKALISFEIKYTEYAGHAIEISKKVAENNEFDSVVAVGGDGSVNEVAKGLIGTKVSLGVLPAGSGNGFARHMEIPLNFKKAILVINKGKTQKVDTGEIGAEKFVGVSGLGFDAYISKKFDEASSRGFWTYLKLTLKEYLSYKERTYQVDFDGEIINLKSLILCFCNTSQWGNNAIISPNSSTVDGKLKMVSLKKMSLFMMPFFAFKLFRKKAHTSKFYKEYEFQKINISQEEELIHIDGEPLIYKKKFQVKVIPSSLSVIS